MECIEKQESISDCGIENRYNILIIPKEYRV